MQKKLRHPMIVIVFTVFVDMLGFGILIPVIPLLLADPASSYYLLAKNVDYSQGYILLGFLTAVFPIGQFFATPILGELSDKFGRKNILAISLAGTCISYLIFALGIFTKNIPLLFISRFFDGITGGNIAVAQAAIADITTPKNRAKNFGLLGAAFGVGFIIGPFIGGKLSDPHVVSWFTATTPFLFAALLSFVNIISVLLLFPETLKTRSHDKVIQWTRALGNIMHAYSMEKLRVLFLTNFLVQSGFSFFITFFSVYLIHKFNFSQGNIGDFFAYIGIWVAFTQGFLTRFIGTKFTDVNILRVTLFGTAVMVFSYLFPTASWQFIFLVPFFAAFNGLTQANSSALVSKSVDATIQGEVLGVNSSVQALAQAIPPILSGYIASNLSPEAPIFVASIVLFIAWLVFFMLYKPTTSNTARV
jgi:MFS transporter, DHA1 family, tetracycline resistance protein